MAGENKAKRSAPLHAFQAKREAWKRGGKQGPEPVRPQPDESEKKAAGKGRFRRNGA